MCLRMNDLKTTHSVEAYREAIRIGARRHVERDRDAAKRDVCRHAGRTKRRRRRVDTEEGGGDTHV